jgi:hypothetical protein
MDDNMAALMSKIDAPPVKMEASPKPCKEERPSTPSIKLEPVETERSEADAVEIVEGDLSVRSQLVAYSSSPPPLIEDCPGLIGGGTNDTPDRVIAPSCSTSIENKLRSKLILFQASSSSRLTSMPR